MTNKERKQILAKLNLILNSISYEDCLEYLKEKEIYYTITKDIVIKNILFVKEIFRKNDNNLTKIIHMTIYRINSEDCSFLKINEYWC